jgi:hypothetical protein
MAEHRNLTWSQLSERLDPRLAVGVLAVVVLVAALAGYLAGSNRSRISIYSGKAYSMQGQIAITAKDGWVYNVPLDVRWTDASGVWHDGDRPVCLPPVGEVPAPVTFAATQVKVNGMTFRPVVWVSCPN